MRTLTHKSVLAADGSLVLSSELRDELCWSAGDQIVISLASNGMVQLRNLTTKSHEVIQLHKEDLERKIREILPKGFLLESLEPLPARVGYGLQLYRPANHTSKDYWDFCSKLKQLSVKHKLELEVRE